MLTIYYKTNNGESAVPQLDRIGADLSFDHLWSGPGRRANGISEIWMVDESGEVVRKEPKCPGA